MQQQQPVHAQQGYICATGHSYTGFERTAAEGQALPATLPPVNSDDALMVHYPTCAQPHPLSVASPAQGVGNVGCLATMLTTLDQQYSYNFAMNCTRSGSLTVRGLVNVSPHPAARLA